MLSIEVESLVSGDENAPSNIGALQVIDSLVNIPPTNGEFSAVNWLTHWYVFPHLQHSFLRREVPTIHRTVYVALKFVLGDVIPSHSIDIARQRTPPRSVKHPRFVGDELIDHSIVLTREIDR